MKLLIDKERIASSIAQAASEIDAEYRHLDPVLIMVLKGAICFTADLIRAMKISCNLQSVQCSSYGIGGTQRGQLTLYGLDALNIKHRDVILVDDIFDSGHTLAALIKELHKQNPRSLKTLVLLDRGTSEIPGFSPDRSLFTIGREFVLGYGLDYKESYRGLPEIYSLEEE